MYTLPRPLILCALAVSICGSSALFSQAQPANDFVSPPGTASYVGAAPVDATQIDPAAALSGAVLVMPPNAADSSAIFMNPTLGRSGTPGGSSAHSNPHTANNGGNVPGLITATTFGGAFAAQGGPSVGSVFPYLMVGNPPVAGNTTNITTNIDEISWTLLNADGSVFKTVEFSPFENLTLNSPNFQDAQYTSSPSPTQFADAVQRAEFYQSLQPGQPWHTRLIPTVVNRVNITVPRFVNVRLSNGSIIQARSYFTGTAADGSTYVLMLNLLFNFFFDNEVVMQINASNFQPDAVNVTAFPNTFLYSLNTTNPNQPGSCCTLGFHTYFYDRSLVPQPRWLTLYESWISPGLFRGGFQDVTALSHEISETFNDPFLNNATPLWQFPGQPAGSKVCQGNLETGDPVEVLPNATFPVTLSAGGKEYTYHPQTEALLPWFGMGSSNALGGAFSYPDTTALTKAAVPCPQ